jgi:hypothetical protein
LASHVDCAAARIDQYLGVSFGIAEASCERFRLGHGVHFFILSLFGGGGQGGHALTVN